MGEGPSQKGAGRKARKPQTHSHRHRKGREEGRRERGQLSIRGVSVASLVSFPRNPRSHDATNIEAIAASLGKFGQLKPIVINHDNVVLAGNGTLEAAKALGWTEVQAVTVDWLTTKEEIGYAIADNRTAELATWNAELAALMEELAQTGEHLELGFSAEEIDHLLAPLYATVAEDVDAASLKPAPATSHSITLVLSEEERATVDKAIQRMRTKLDSVDAPFGRCIALVCHQWMEAQR